MVLFFIARATAIFLAAVAFFVPALPVAQASEILGAQAVDQPATLVGSKAKAPIPLYLRPAPNQPNVGYGISGDPVTVMEQLASFLPEADPTTAWNHVRLRQEPYTEGWVQGKFLAFSTAVSEETP